MSCKTGDAGASCTPAILRASDRPGPRGTAVFPRECLAMSPFASPMFLAPATATARRYRGEDFARRERGFAPRYARPARPTPAATVLAWPGCALARVGDAWVVQDCARAA